MPNSHRPSFRGKRYVVSSLHYLATMAGVRILESGGNAADAGVATGICINVLQPGSAQFGGVAPIIYCPASGEPVETISGLGRWPKAATMDYFHEHHDGDLPAGILRTVMPAAPDGWLTALSRFGTMRFEEVIQPALDLVENGRPVDDQFYGLSEWRRREKLSLQPPHPTTPVGMSHKLEKSSSRKTSQKPSNG